jgi:hypothetical protein
VGEASPVAEVSDNEPRSNPQDEVKRALTEYCHFPHSQGFAVMLNGAWGSGKTRFIKDCAESFVRQRPGEVPLKPLYVSLYGVSETSQIDELLFQQMHPILSHKATRLAGAVLRGIGKLAVKVDLGHVAQLTGTVPEVNLASMLAGADGRVVIFDDFERALMKPAAILGYINPMVEHEDCKTVIIADEGQIDGSNKSDYEKRKEKTVGQTFQFEPDTQRVYDSFLKEIDNEEARTFLAQSKSVLLQVFADSCLKNMRLLKQLLWDFERIWKVLTPEQRAQSVAMQELLTLVCAAALELRSGRLAESDFQFVRPTSPMDETRNRYPTVRFDSALLDADTIRDCVLRSRVSKGGVQKQLASHPYFANDRQVIPSWRALWLSFEVCPDKQDELVEKFEVDFDARRFEDQGVIYHVIGLSLWLTHLGYPNWLDTEVESKVQRYVADVYSRRDATFEEASEREMFDESMGFDGLGYRESEDPRFRALVKFEREQRTAWRKRAYPDIAAYLLQLAKSDSQGFLREVCFTNAGPSNFASIGVMKLIPADQFAAAIAAAPYRDQKNIIMALSIRYEQAVAYVELRDELPWLREVKSHLDVATKTLPRIARNALSNLTRRYVDETIAKVEQNSRPAE